MALQRTAELSQRGQHIGREVPRLGEHGINQGRGVTLAEEESVPLGPVGVLRIVAEMEMLSLERGVFLEVIENLERIEDADIEVVRLESFF